MALVATFAIFYSLCPPSREAAQYFAVDGTMRSTNIILAILIFPSLLAGGLVRPAHGQTPGKLDTAAIDKAIGKSGTMMAGDVYRIAFPRTDLDVTANGVKLRAGFALGGWAAFCAVDGGAVLHGDLVLTEPEINPMISKLEQSGIEITALHNHVLGETPHVSALLGPR